MPASPTSADRNLLYGVVALQLGFVSRDALIDGMGAWASSKAKSLDRVLVERGAIDEADHAAIDHAVRRQLEKRREDASRCLAALDFELSTSVQALLKPIGDDDLEASLGRLGSTGEASRSGSRRDSTTLFAERPGPSSGVLEVAPEVLGDRFRPLRLHARGGLGEVFLAWDEELGRYVALKEIRTEHADHPGLRARFVREAEVNGNLEHPGIVPVYGLGHYPDGRPYYAMRFVRGETLQRAVDRFQEEMKGEGGAAWALAIRPLLRRFIDVCEAIAYAHSRSVLHRDLKPANVMLGRYGETLIIDWGLAKVIGRPEPGSDAVTRTAEMDALAGPVRMLPSGSGPISTLAGETLGSPPYMSPEQARGRHDELDESSDVYSLGATLFAILTGRPPVVGSGTKETVAKVGKGQIDRPRVVEPRVPPPLEAVCLKALRLEPGERYASARALADDLEHWLADQPVSVYRDPFSTRLLRWTKRNRSLVASSLAVLVAAVVGLSAATVIVDQQKRAARNAEGRALHAYREAQTARQRASEHLRIGLDVFEQLITLGDRQIATQMSAETRARFLESAVGFIREFREREPGDLDLQKRTGMVARRLANLYQLTGRFGQAEPFYEEAVRVFEGLERTHPGRADYANLLAQTLIDQGESATDGGRAVAALPVLERAVSLARGLDPAGSSTVDETRARRTLGRALGQLGSAELAVGSPRASATTREAIDTLMPLAEAGLEPMRETVAKGGFLPLTDQLALIQGLARRARALDHLGDLDGVRGELDRAFDRVEEVGRRLEGLPIADVEYYRAWVRVARGRIDGARDGVDAGLDDAVDRLERLVGANPDVLHYRLGLADARSVRARRHFEAARAVEAAGDVERAGTLLDRLPGETPVLPEALSLLGEVLGIEARLALASDPPDRSRAAEALDRAFALQQRALKVYPDQPLFRRRLDELRADRPRQ